MTCALPCWIMRCPLSVFIQLFFHSLLLFLLYPCQSFMPLRHCSLKLSLSRTRTTQTLFWHVLSLSLSLVLSSFFSASSFIFFAFGNNILFPPSSSLTHSAVQSLLAPFSSAPFLPPGFQRPQRPWWFTNWPCTTPSKDWLSVSNESYWYLGTFCVKVLKCKVIISCVLLLWYFIMELIEYTWKIT